VEEVESWVVEDYSEPGGRRPVRKFVEGLTDSQDKTEAAALLKQLQARGNQMREPQSKALGDGLFELRGEQVRIYYTFRPGRRVILLDGMVKKKDKIPPEFLERLRKLEQTIPKPKVKSKREKRR
jgi:hypothetical protein